MESDKESIFAKLSRKKRFLYSLVLLAIPLLTLELGLRAFFAYQEGSSILLYGTRFYRKKMNEDPHVGTMNHHETYWKYYPHQERFTRNRETGRRIPVTINSSGFRGNEFSIQKPPDTIRIIALGASSTFGFSNKDDETYPFFMEQMLNARCDNSNHYEVINFGIPHLKSDQILAMFLSEGLPLRPDVVTFYAGVNDSWDSPVRRRRLRTELSEFRERARRISLLNRCYTVLRDHSVSILLVDQLLKKHDLRFSRPDFEAHLKGKSDYFVHNLSEVYKACRQNGILLIVASQQAKSFIVDREHIRGVTYEQEGEMVAKKLATQHHITDKELYFLTHMNIMKLEAEWVRTNNVHFVDIIRTLDQRRDVLLSWVHLNPEGNHLVAEAFTSAIMKHLCPEDTLTNHSARKIQHL